MKLCPNCGANCNDDVVFCTECGKNFEEAFNPDTAETVEPIKFGEAFKLLFKKTFEFKGRISKREYWLCFAWWMIVVCVFEALAITNLLISLIPYVGLLTLPISFILGAAGTLLSIPNISAMWRRIQDTGKPGALALITFVCILVPLAFCLMDGENGANKYGEKPLR